MPTTTSTTTFLTTLTPAQTGVVTDYYSFYEAVSGDGCYDIATAHNITLAYFKL